MFVEVEYSQPLWPQGKGHPAWLTALLCWLISLLDTSGSFCNLKSPMALFSLCPAHYTNIEICRSVSLWCLVNKLEKSKVDFNQMTLKHITSGKEKVLTFCLSSTRNHQDTCLLLPQASWCPPVMPLALPTASQAPSWPCTAVQQLYTGTPLGSQGERKKRPRALGLLRPCHRSQECRAAACWGHLAHSSPVLCADFPSFLPSLPLSLCFSFLFFLISVSLIFSSCL